MAKAVTDIKHSTGTGEKLKVTTVTAGEKLNKSDFPAADWKALVEAGAIQEEEGDETRIVNLNPSNTEIAGFATTGPPAEGGVAPPTAETTTGKSGPGVAISADRLPEGADPAAKAQPEGRAVVEAQAMGNKAAIPNVADDQTPKQKSEGTKK